ncbi:hypothetical protein SAMN05660971_01007 [Halomonas cupida]|uniref:Uncharacterized protein n=1 Tax=Halomonas cupida TaxID=44933 RepID=A0A1M7C8U0_9GAMM|nr:hypothetical protein SAMN05660971_01007 [Halomonas cupida]
MECHKCGVSQVGMISARHTGSMARRRLQGMADPLSKSGNTASGPVWRALWEPSGAAGAVLCPWSI